MVLAGVVRHDLTRRSRSLEIIRSRLLQLSPAMRVQQSIGRLGELQQRLNVAGGATLTNRQARLRLATRALDSVSPLATLERGYSIVSDAISGEILTDVSSVKAGTEIRAQLAHGALQATVTTTKSANSDD